MEPPHDTTIEVKEQQLMVSPLSGENPVHRTAYFIKPCVEDSATLPHLMFSSRRTGTVNSSDLAKLLDVRYNGWHYPNEEWSTWIHLMRQKYECVWMKAGIDQAIKASTFQIRRNDELIIELAQRWCSKTNTFLFPWGEATITLEDMKVCWGFSVLGAPFAFPFQSDEEMEIEQELYRVFRSFFKTKAKRADHNPWMRYFMNNESHVEHEAFLSLWLSRFVFPGKSHKSIVRSVFPIAIHLARGIKLALAPAVLASIYRDLSLLNNKIRIAATVKLEVTLWAPFQLVQVWVLERFPVQQPRPDAVEQGQLLMAKWHAEKMLKVGNLKLILDSFEDGNGFIWRPYENSPAIEIYNENDMWVCNSPNFDGELESFARCLRVSELVGVDCIEQYCPNRVAMQFGMDQDIPGMLAHYNENPWTSYSQPVMHINLYTALCAGHQPNVTSRYYCWWKQSNPCKEEDIYDHCVESGSEHLLPTSSSIKQENGGSYGPPPSFTSKIKTEQEEEKETGGSYGPPPGFTSKIKTEQEEDFDEEGKMSVIELSNSSDEVRCLDDEEVGNGKALSSPLSDVFASESVEGARSVKENGSKVIIQNSYCERDGVSNKEGEDVGHHIANIASNLESRIGKLERVIADVKEAKFGHKVQNVGVKRKHSAR